MELDSATMFTPRTSAIFIRSTRAPALGQVVGYSEHGHAYRSITYECEGKTVLHDCASPLIATCLSSPTRRLVGFILAVNCCPKRSLQSMVNAFLKPCELTPTGGGLHSSHGLHATREKSCISQGPKGAAGSIPVESGDHVQEFKVKWSKTKEFYTEPLKEMPFLWSAHSLSFVIMS